MRIRRLGETLVLVLAMAAVAAPTSAQFIQFPPPPDNVAAAEHAFDQRAAVVIHYNACEREVEYASLRREMRDGQYSGQIERLPSILIAKIAWLTNPQTARLPCVSVLRTAVPAGTSDEEFERATLGAWIDPTVPTRCSAEGSSARFVREPAETQRYLLVQFRVTPECMRKQVNEAIRAMVKDRFMGTDNLLCPEGFGEGWLATFLGAEPKKDTGDFDVTVRDLTRILYMGTIPRHVVLEPETIKHMYERLLAARGEPSDGSYRVLDCDDPAGDELGNPEDYADREYWYNEVLGAIGDLLSWLTNHVAKKGAMFASVGGGLLYAAAADPVSSAALAALDIRIPETENHRLMIESSRYLINAKIIQHLELIQHDNVDEIREKQAEVREWLLKTLQTISIQDFQEYNSKPYTKYSLNAILNLYDFASDFDDQGYSALRTASRIVLDLSAAKFAAASSRGRRVVPFRRLADKDETLLYDGIDHEVARSIVLTGQTHLLAGGFHHSGLPGMIHPAVGSYRLPRAVLEVALERSEAIEQEIRHASFEHYYSTPAFTMSLGGGRSPAPLDVMGFDRAEDRGVAMPTVIIPATSGHRWEDLFAFLGAGRQHERTDNACGWQGFTCGIEPRFPTLFSGSHTITATVNGHDALFVNSADYTAPPHFYLAMMRGRCTGAFCDAARTYGVMEAVEARSATPGPDPQFLAFVTTRLNAFTTAAPAASGQGTYVNTRGVKIAYRVHDDGSYLLSLNGQPPQYRRDVIVREQQSPARVAIVSPGRPSRVMIDFSVWNAPTWREDR